VVIVLIKLCKRRFRGSWSTNLAAGPAVVLVFRSGFFVLFIYPPQLMWNYGSNTSGAVVVVSRKLFVLLLFSGLGLSFTIFHKSLDQAQRHA
jgi:hypothetical protein